MNAKRRRTSWQADLGASSALALYSVAVAAGFARVFSGWQFLDELVPIVIAGHGTGFVVRRARLSAWIGVPLTVVAVVWVGAALFYADTLGWGVPTPATWDLAWLELETVREQFDVAVAPVLYGSGWDLLAAVGMAIAVVLADVFAFRAYARAEALVPGGVLFVFVGALGSDRHRVALTVALVMAGIVAVIVLRWYHAADAPTAQRPSLRRIAPAAIASMVLIAFGAGYVGPRLPGADAAPVYDARGGAGSSATVVSPLVDIRSRLTNRSQAELFRVNADVESYWRASALSSFDGRIWTLPDQTLQPADAELPPRPPGIVENRQRVTITGLEGSLVPAAAESMRAGGPDDLRLAPETSTLITIDGDLSPGDTIDVVSWAPVLDAEILEAATSTDPGAAIYTALPDDLPDVVAETASQVTAGARTPYEAARLLQGWFQREFDYSLEVQPGHGNNAIETFLRERVGYCEQFAGTYAAMMRSIGIPSRVAVGFTSGSRISDRVFSVRGRNAHAWPEVWFDGIGWVAFEPTPGRGAPNAEAYTGLQPRQDTTPIDEDVDDAEDATPPPVTTAAGPQNLEPINPADLDAGAIVPERLEESDDGAVNPLPLVVVSVLAGLVALPAVVRRIRRGRHASSPEAQLGRVWRRAVGAVEAAGVRIDPADTPLEAAAATSAALPIVGRPFAQLADVVTDAVYGPAGMARLDEVGQYGASTLRRCQSWARQIDRTIGEANGPWRRVQRYFTVWR